MQLESKKRRFYADNEMVEGLLYSYNMVAARESLSHLSDKAVKDFIHTYRLTLGDATMFLRRNDRLTKMATMYPNMRADVKRAYEQMLLHPEDVTRMAQIGMANLRALERMETEAKRRGFKIAIWRNRQHAREMMHWHSLDSNSVTSRHVN